MQAPVGTWGLKPWPDDDVVWLAEQIPDFPGIAAYTADIGSWKTERRSRLYLCMDHRLSADTIRQKIHELLRGLQDPAAQEMTNLSSFLMSSPGGNMPVLDFLAYKVLARAALQRKVRWVFTHFLFAPHNDCAGRKTGLGLGPKEGIEMCVGIHQAARVIYPDLFVGATPRLTKVRMTEDGEISKIGRPIDPAIWDRVPPFVLDEGRLVHLLTLLGLMDYLPAHSSLTVMPEVARLLPVLGQSTESVLVSSV